MTMNEFAVAMAVLECGMGKKLDADTLDVWYTCLSDVALSSLQQAILRFLREGDDWPSIAKIRRLAVGDAEPDIQDRATAAWDACFRALSRVGGYLSVDFDDPLINATVRSLGGWERLTGLETTELVTWTRKDFERTYRALSKIGASEEMTSPLAGICDCDNSKTNHPADREPVKISTMLPPHRNPRIRRGVAQRKALPAPHPSVKKLASSTAVSLPQRRLHQEPTQSRDEQIAQLKSMERISD